MTRLGWDTVIWIAHSLTSAVVLARVFLAPPDGTTPSDNDDDNTMATAPTNQPVLGEDGKPLSPKSSTTYNEDVVSFTDPADGTQKRAVVTVSPHTHPRSLHESALMCLPWQKQRCWADEQAPEAVAEAARIGVPFTPVRPSLSLSLPAQVRIKSDEGSMKHSSRLATWKSSSRTGLAPKSSNPPPP